MKPRHFLVFADKVTAAHIVTYLRAGTIAYPFFTKEFYVGSNPVFKLLMRAELEPELWGHVAAWFLPGLILEGFLIAAALYPFFDALMIWPFRKRFLCISGLYIVLGFWAAPDCEHVIIGGHVVLMNRKTLVLRTIQSWLIHLLDLGGRDFGPQNLVPGSGSLRPW
jgi:hypothetical protein